MAIYNGFSHWKWWFSIAMLVYQRVSHVSHWNIHVKGKGETLDLWVPFLGPITNLSDKQYPRERSTNDQVEARSKPSQAVANQDAVIPLISSLVSSLFRLPDAAWGAMGWFPWSHPPSPGPRGRDYSIALLLVSNSIQKYAHQLGSSHF